MIKALPPLAEIKRHRRGKKKENQPEWSNRVNISPGLPQGTSFSAYFAATSGHLCNYLCRRCAVLHSSNIPFQISILDNVNKLKRLQPSECLFVAARRDELNVKSTPRAHRENAISLKSEDHGDAGSRAVKCDGELIFTEADENATHAEYLATNISARCSISSVHEVKYHPFSFFTVGSGTS